MELTPLEQNHSCSLQVITRTVIDDDHHHYRESMMELQQDRCDHDRSKLKTPWVIPKGRPAKTNAKKGVTLIYVNA